MCWQNTKLLKMNNIMKNLYYVHAIVVFQVKTTKYCLFLSTIIICRFFRFSHLQKLLDIFLSLLGGEGGEKYLLRNTFFEIYFFHHWVHFSLPDRLVLSVL